MGTLEAGTWIIKKEDGTLKTVSHSVQLITTGLAVVKGLEELRDLAAVANQVLYDYQLQSPVQCGKSLESSKDTQTFLKLLDKFVFSVSFSLVDHIYIFEQEEGSIFWQKEILLLGSLWQAYILAHHSLNDETQQASRTLTKICGILPRLVWVSFEHRQRTTVIRCTFKRRTMLRARLLDLLSQQLTC
jgi:hypothetical protein